MNGVSPLKHGFVDLAAVLFVIGGVVSFGIDSSINSYYKPVPNQSSVEFQYGLRCSSSYGPNLFYWGNSLLQSCDETFAFRGGYEGNDLRSVAIDLESRCVWKFQFGRKFRSSYFQGLPYRTKLGSHSRRGSDLLLASTHERICF